MRRVVVTGMGGRRARWATTGRRSRRAARRQQRRRGACRSGSIRGPEHAARRARVADFAPPSTTRASSIAQHGPGRADGDARHRARARGCRPARRPVLPSGAHRRRLRLLAAARRRWRTSARMLIGNDIDGINANTYIQMMPHTTAANIGVFFGLHGPRHPHLERLHLGQPGHRLRLRGDPHGQQTACWPAAPRSSTPPTPRSSTCCSRPVDAQRRARAHAAALRRRRDGLVVGEGAGTLVLEELEHARARGARSSPRSSASAPTATARTSRTRRGRHGAARCALALRGRAASTPDAIGYVNAHGTATEHGDIAESQATHAVFGAARADQLAQELHRPHARRLRRDRGVDDDRDDARGLVRADAQPRDVDPRCAPLDYVVGERPRARDGLRDEQQLRLRRHQHVADLPPIDRGVSLARRAGAAPPTSRPVAGRWPRPKAAGPRHALRQLARRQRDVRAEHVVRAAVSDLARHT